MTSHEESVIRQLVAQVADLLARDTERENTRVLLRAKDDHWRDRTEIKIDKVIEKVEALDDALAALPEERKRQIDEGIERHVCRGQEKDRGRRTTFIMVVVFSVLACAATLEYVDRENSAAIVFAFVALLSPFVVWMLTRK